MRIYISGSWKRRAELDVLAQNLNDVGVLVTSRWLTNALDKLDEQKQAEADLADIDVAAGVLFFAEDKSAGYLTGGRHVEMGYALARNKWVWVIGKPENVFHALRSRRVTCYPNLSTWMSHMGLKEIANASVPRGPQRAGVRVHVTNGNGRR